MATIKGGLTPVRSKGSAPTTNGMGPYLIDNGYATNIGQGALVKIGTDGYLQLRTDADTDDAVGVFAGCKYISAVDGKPKESPNFVAGTSNAGIVDDGITDVLAYVYDDPDQEFLIEADATLAQTNIGEVFITTGNGTVDTYGRAATQLDVGGVVASNDIVKIVGKAALVDNALTDANPIVRVVLTRHSLARQS